MGLFNKNSNQLKVGKGVDKDARKKNAFFTFFELLYRKFTKLFLLNIVYAICISPIICAVVAFLTVSFQLSEEIVKGSFLITNVMKIVLRVPAWVSIPVLIADIVFFGPLTAGFTYMLRNYATERHAWFTDFFSRAMANFKQGVALGIMDAVVFLSIVLYMAADISGLKGDMMYYFYLFLKTAACIIAVLYVFMRYYTYTIAVTFDLPLKDIMKNAFIFSVLGFFRNVIATVAIVVTVFAFTSTWIIDAVLLITFLFAFCGFIATYTTYPVVKKYMLPDDEADDDDETDDIPAEDI